MTEPSPVNPAGAGLTLVATMLLCAGLGAAAGALVGVPVLLGLVGLFAGGVVGFVVVRARFKDL
ncbi:hypothetical protein [Thermoleophilum album]|uniref:Uncharacterized protein n=1 Tax=Thermoleophilum album TaxID=29539 RepID=A0A1H6FIT9_THEAL|nr:hypothetical protein [Thermoleophilum album]SEH10322.1 hypothetical protein SAMN02745716_0171 [Thermoleophilum album]